MKEKIFEVLSKSYETYVSELAIKHQAHLERVRTAIGWWESNLIKEDYKDTEAVSIKTKPNLDISVNTTSHKKPESFCGTKVKYEGVNCMVTRNDFTGTPFFYAEFNVRPMSASDTVGSGAGASHTIKF